MTIAHAVNSSDLSHVEHRLCDADVLHALGRSNPLGVALLHVRDGNDAGRYNECLTLFRAACIKRVQQSKRESVRTLYRGLVAKAAEMVLREYLLDVCPTCLGTDLLDYGERRAGERRQGHGAAIGERRYRDRRFICPDCKGTKKPLLDDKAHTRRRHVLGIGRETYYATWERLLPEFINLLLVAERRCRGNVKKLLEPLDI